MIHILYYLLVEIGVFIMNDNPKICSYCGQTIYTTCDNKAIDTDVEKRIEWFLKWFSKRMPIPNLTWSEHLIDFATMYPKSWLEKAGERFFAAGTGKPITYLARILKNWEAVGSLEPWKTQWKTPPPNSDWAKAEEKDEVKKPRTDCPKCKGKGYIIDFDNMNKPAFRCDCWDE